MHNFKRGREFFDQGAPDLWLQCSITEHFSRSSLFTFSDREIGTGRI
jgi:hypothetical protein|tara:strand:+ start:3139 stop:3279 length:141 start_codon:yes stop_codon:yes gene_type:complete